MDAPDALVWEIETAVVPLTAVGKREEPIWGKMATSVLDVLTLRCPLKTSVQMTSRAWKLKYGGQGRLWT